MTVHPTPFTLSIPQISLDDLCNRLANTRLPDQTPGPAWQFGTDRSYMSELVQYWRVSFDWRAQEAALNQFPQFMVNLHGIDLHYLYIQGAGPNPTPLLLMHGWPGSVFEFLDMIPILTDPEQFGGDPSQSFTIIAPSLPGFGLSFQPNQKRFGAHEMADCFVDLMVNVLGFDRFALQGGDWGSFVASSIAMHHSDHVIGMHLNMLPIRPDPVAALNATEEEVKYACEIAHWAKDETGYTWIQATRPQTLAYGLTDSPAGLAAWIAEKFYAWTDHDGTIETAVARDRMLANVSLYWFTGAIGSSFWPYYERHHTQWTVPDDAHITVPTGYAAFPAEIRRPPRSIAQKVYRDLRHWSAMPKGGHFAALEHPHALAADITKFFNDLRPQPFTAE